MPLAPPSGSCACFRHSLREHTGTVPSMLEGIKDPCDTGLFLPLLRGCLAYFYGYLASGFLCLTHSHILGTSQEYRVQLHRQVTCLPGCHPRERWKPSQCLSLGPCCVFVSFSGNRTLGWRQNDSSCLGCKLCQKVVPVF